MSRWLKVLIFSLTAVGVILASIPLWLGVALHLILRSYGVTFASYERLGYTHFRLRDAVYANGSVSILAAQVQSATPLVWLGQRLRGTAPTITVENWSVQILPSQTGPAAGQPTPSAVTSMPDLLAVFRNIGPPLLHWLPRAHLKTGVIRGLGPDFTIAEADWRNATLTIEGLHLAEHLIALAFTATPDGTITLAAHTAGNEAQLHVTWSGADLKGEATVWAQPVQLSARFPAHGWLPAEASAVAAHWQLPAARVRLGAPYAQVHGDGRLDWHDGAFDLALAAAAEPAPGTKAPPFSARAAAHGNLRELTVTALAVDAPFATAKLTAPVTLSRDRPLAAEAAQLIVQADLAKLPWLEASGTVQGTVNVNGDTAAAQQTFQLEFTEIKLPDFAVQQAQARGFLRWPLLELTTLDIQLDKTSRLEAHGAVNFQTHELTGAAVQAKLGPAWFARWLPAGTTWTAAELSATAEGPLDAPRHQGSLKLTELKWPPLHPLLVDATWTGTGPRAETVTAHVATAHSAIDLASSLDAHGLQLAKLSFTAADQLVWQLTAPARLTWSPGWQLDSLALAGPASQLALKGNGGPAGSFNLTVSHFDSAWLQDWVPLAGPAWQLHTLQADGHVADGVLVFATTLTAQIAMSPQPAQVKLVASGDAHGVQLKEMSVIESGRVLTQATGRLALTWRVQPTPHFEVDDAAPLELTASTEPDSPLWATLSAATGVAFTSPTAKIKLQGTLRQPTGDLQVRAVRMTVTANKSSFTPPECDDLTLAVQFSRERVTLTTFTAMLDGQAVQASGELPMSDARWQELWHTPAALDWSEAEGKLVIPDADLAAFAQRAPDFIATRGRLRAHVELGRGGNFSGELHLTDAASRPLPPFGTLQEINADLALADRTLTVRTLTAKLGGEPVTLDGHLTLVPGAAPRLALGLKGTNLPLVRNTGLIVRTDLDLHATTAASAVTRLTGSVTLRDSLVLANFNSLLPTGPRGVTRQPPYFAVETEPYRRWPLDVAVRGQGAVRIRTTVFNGTTSARFHLGGTLGEPRAVGDLTVDQGQVLFPFASFKVQQGTLRLSEADPFHARINLVAGSQRRDFQLRLEVTGLLPSPLITLSSTPALESGDVLLMVMTGRPPTGESTSSSAERFALLGAYLGRGIFQDLGIGGEDRLEFSTGEQVSEQGRETYEFDYKLGEKWSLVGEYDRFDGYNAGLKWRVYTQESAPHEKK